MTKHDYLREYLKGNQLRVDCPEQEAAYLTWAMKHQPLISPNTFTSRGRYLNHFCVGSDPEFSLADRAGRRIEAYSLGLKVGLAVGSDQNERLVELRPFPAVSVVEHVAGILTALRWFYRVYGHSVRDLNWRAGAFFAGDGMGGHVHFGRKRPTRTEEVEALDGLACVFKATGLFPIREWTRRMQGDEHRQRYGLPGDFRIQRHGYEYRSLPSWLQSPTVAFIVLAASKLAVLDPAISTVWKQHTWDMNSAQDALRGLAKLYKSRDDDAYILYHLLTTNGNSVFVVNYENDFSSAWGFSGLIPTDPAEASVILPASIKPTEQEINEIHNHLLLGTSLHYAETIPSFVTKLPSNRSYVWVPAMIHPARRAGFGDLIHNLVYSEQAPILWDYTTHPELRINGYAVNTWTVKDIEFIRSAYPRLIFNLGRSSDKATCITVPRDLCQTQAIAGFRNLLLETGLFPLWTVETVREDSISNWLKTHSKLRMQPTWRNV